MFLSCFQTHGHGKYRSNKEREKREKNMDPV